MAKVFPGITDNGVYHNVIAPGEPYINQCWECGQGFVMHAWEDGTAVYGDDLCWDCHDRFARMMFEDSNG